MLSESAETEQQTVSNHIAFRVNRGLEGDCAEVVRSNVFKKFTFPTFENERFLGDVLSNMYLENGIALHVQVKHAILYDYYAMVSGRPVHALQKSNRKCLCVLIMPFGIFFYMKWSRNKKR